MNRHRQKQRAELKRQAKRAAKAAAPEEARHALIRDLDAMVTGAWRIEPDGSFTKIR